MATNDAPTIKTHRTPTVLLVGFAEPFARACERVASKVGVRIASAAAGDESSFVMQAVPLAVLVNPAVEPDPGFVTIARELDIELRRVRPDEVGDLEHEALLADAVAAARARRAERSRSRTEAR